MKERRRFARLDESWPVKYKIVGKIRTGVRSRTVNVSAIGVRFYTNAILSPGDILELDLFIPADPSPVYIKGKVVWQGKVIWCKEADNKDKWPLEVGVEFINLDVYDKERMDTYINSRLGEEKSS